MFRILAIGRSSQYIQEVLQSYEIEIELAKLPAAGVRAMERTPPDLVIIHDLQTSPALWLLVEGIRVRPLGKLTPILVLAPPPKEKQNVEQHVQGWISPDSTGQVIISKIAALLGMSEDDFERKKAASSSVPQTQSPPLIQHGAGYTIEEIPRELIQERELEALEEITAEHVRRMTRSVRHEDYFTILGVSRSAKSEIVQNAYQTLSQRFAPEKVNFDLRRSFQAELAEIQDALEDAWAVLGDDALRESYLHATTRG